MSSNETGNDDLLEWAKDKCRPALHKYLGFASIRLLAAHYKNYNPDAGTLPAAIYVDTKICSKLYPGRTPDEVIDILKPFNIDELKLKLRGFSAHDLALFKTFLVVNGVYEAQHVKLDLKRNDVTTFETPLRVDGFTKIVGACRNNEELLKVYFPYETVQRFDTIVDLRWNLFTELDEPDHDFLIKIEACMTKDRVVHPAPVGPNVRALLREKKRILQQKGKYDPNGLIFDMRSSTYSNEISEIMDRVPGLRNKTPGRLHHSVVPYDTRTLGFNEMMKNNPDKYIPDIFMGHKQPKYIHRTHEECLDNYHTYKPTIDENLAIQNLKETAKRGALNLDLKGISRGSPSLSGPSPQPLPTYSSEKWLPIVSQLAEPYRSDSTFKIELQGSYIRGLTDTCEVFRFKAGSPSNETTLL